LAVAKAGLRAFRTGLIFADGELDLQDLSGAPVA
jgi:hypothetical protein